VISLLSTFFDQNQAIIQFTYGLSFFVMGLAIALQSRSSSRLELARSLAWLAAFGITHGLYLWGELFAPVQEAYLSPRGIEILHSLHLFTLSLSFVCLIEFGIALLRPLGKGQWLHWITLAWAGAFLFFILVWLPRVARDLEVWHHTAEALARYTLGFPGGLLAAYGLREQTFRQIAPLEAPHIVSTLRATGVTLAVYAVLGGLVPPPVPFFPGNWLNTTTFEQAVGIPPFVFLSAIGLVLVVTVIRAMEIFQVEMERSIEAMEQAQILAAERERIARQLHDNTIQNVYTAGLLIDSARKLSEADGPIASRLDKAVMALNDVIHDLRRSLGELHEVPSDEALSVELQRIAQDPRFRSLVEISLDLDLPQEARLAPRDKDHLLSIVHEALSNVIRHAHARQVKLQACQEAGRLVVVVQDDGTGLPEKFEAGYGLRNMQERARLLGGQLQITNPNGKGTRVTLEIPLAE
jgi:signal transduction histidine kinase